MANLNFDASKIETNSYQPLPDGWYPVAIVEADMVRTKDGSNEYLKLCYEITGPEYTGRKVFDGFRMIYRATDLGRIKSVATIPAISTHQQQGEEQHCSAHRSPEGL